MNNDSHEEALDQLEEKVARLAELHEDLAVRLEKLKVTLAGPLRQQQKSQYLMVAAFLLSRKNKPRSTRSIAKGTNIALTSLSQILHRTHKDSFVSTLRPGYARRKLWSLTEKAAADAVRAIRQRSLFDVDGEFNGMKAVDCCARILKDHGNEPMNALTMAKEALRRGYSGYKVRGSEDEVLLTTAKSFWAALGRDERFTEVRPLVFALKSTAEEDETS